MAKKIDIGKQGENLACIWLTEQGYQIIAQNWRFQKAEIDIIALVDNELVFVEVKSRKYEEDLPELAVNEKKQNLIKLAAEEYCATTTHFFDTVRFDIIAIRTHIHPPEITQFKDAFR